MSFRDLKLRVRALFTPNRVEQELNDELAFHIERETSKLIEAGHAAGRGARDARRRASDPRPLAADECRDERGTAFIDNTIRDIQYALRTFRRAPLAAFTIVVTVAIGLGVVAVLFTVLNTFLFRVDKVPDITRCTASSGRPRPTASRSRFTRPQFEAMRSGDQRLHRRLRRVDRHRSARRRPHDGRHARHRQLLPGRGRQSGDGTRADARRRSRRAAIR